MNITATTDLSAFTRFADTIGRALATPASSPGPLQEGVREQAELYSVDIQKRFNNASGGDGTWVRLKPKTIKKKSRVTLFPGRILYLNGDLYLSLLIGQINNVFETRDDRLVYGTRDPKAIFHQHGVPARNLPARPILVGPSDDLNRRLAAVMVVAWREAVDNAQRP